LDNAFRDKPVIVMDDSAGLFAAAWAQADLRRVVAIIGANVIDREMAIREAEQAFGINGRLIDPDVEAQLTELVELLATLAGTDQRNVA
jgi:chromate reductase, NAD(P)H dehydrogenase (quinone)